MMLFNPAINPSIKQQQQQPQSESAVGSPTLRFKLKPLSPRINPILSNEKSIQVPIPNHIELKNDSVTPKNQPIILVNDLDKSKQSITSSEPTFRNAQSKSNKDNNKIMIASPQIKHADFKKLPKIINRLYNAVVNENESTQFLIKLNSKEWPSYKWYRDEIEIKLNENLEVIENEDEITLVIKSCKAENNGTYYIKFKNSFGEVISNKAKLIINKVPKFVKKPTNTYIQLNQISPLKFECSVEALPKAKIDWYQNEKELSGKDGFKIETDLRLGTCNLLISKVNVNAHLGRYTIKAVNTVGTAEHSFELGILEHPKIFGTIADLSIHEGDQAKFTVEIASGKPQPTVQWFYNECEIDLTLTDLYEIIENEKFNSLIIKSTTLKNSGTFYVKLFNEAGSDVSNRAKLLVKPPKKPKITILPANFLKPLDEVTYGCLSKIKEFPVHIVSKPIARIKVYKDEKEIKSSSHLKFESEKLNENTIGFKLIIENTQASDSGLYRIEAINKHATVSTQTQFIVKGEPVFVRKPAELITVSEKKQINIYCEVIGFPMPSVYWYKDDKLLEKTENIQIESKGKGLNLLLIKSVTLENVGTYRIKAKNETDQIECTFSLVVDVAPYFISPVKDKIVLAGEPVTFECLIGGNPQPTVTWEKKGEEIKVSKQNGIEIIKDGNRHVLSMRSTLTEDATIYTLLASNRLGKIQSKFELIVKCAPYFKRKTEDVLVVEKRTIKLEVEIHSVPKAHVTWLKDGREIKKDDRIQFNDAKGGVYQLTIKNSNRDDTGTYACRAFNEIGKAECSAELSIEKAPEFTKKLDKLVAAEQCEAEWIFQLIGLPKPSLEISRNNEILDIDSWPDLYSIDELEDKHYCLKFNCVSKKDVGTWRITALNAAGKATTINKLECMSLSPPFFIRGLTNTQMPENLDNHLEVLVNGLPFPEFVWFKNDQKINLDFFSRKFKLEFDKENGSIRLVILRSSSEDSGIYKITIANPGGEASSEAIFSFKGFQPKIVEKPESIKVLKNSKATFAICADGDPQPSILWTKGALNLTESSKFDIFYDETIDTHFLEILDCNSNDAGQYKATASNIFGSEIVLFTLNVTQNKFEISHVQDFKAKLKSRPPRKLVEGKPDCKLLPLKKNNQLTNNRQNAQPDTPKLKHWQNEYKKFLKELPHELKVPEHKNATFECTVADVNAKVEWYLNEKLIDQTIKKFENFSVGNSRMITLFNCLLNESYSNIKCKWDDLETSCRLIVSECPFIIKNEMIDQKVLNNSDVFLECEILCTLTYPYTLSWKKNNKPIDFDTNKRKYEFTVVEDTYQLKIKSFCTNDDGIYEIYVSEPNDFHFSAQAKIEVDPSIIPKRPVIKHDSRYHRDIILLPKQNLSIICEIGGVPKPRVRWFKNYTEITHSLSRGFIETASDYSRLQIDGVRFEETGEYTIKVENDIGKSEAKFSVKILNVPSQPENFKCLDVSSTSSRLSWLAPESDGNSPILAYCIEKYDQKREWIGLGKTSLNEFFIEKLEKGQIYKYRILAENKVGLSQPSEIIIDIPNDTPKEVETNFSKPVLIEPLKDVKTLRGDIAYFDARVSSKQPLDIKWFFEDRPLRSLDAFSKIKNDYIELALNGVETLNEGIYKMIAKNIYGEVCSEARLTVLKKPEIRYISKADISLFSKQSLNICCEINGNPKPSVKWYKDGLELEKAFRVKFEQSEEVIRLLIDKTKFSDSGDYTIKAENEVGKTETKFSVKILDTPQPPVNFIIEDVSSTSSRLSWNAPESDGNSTIISYHIERYDPSRYEWTRLGKTSLNEFFIEKFEKGQIFNYRVFAENKVGISEPCEIKEIKRFIKHDLPSCPKPPIITDITSSSCRVSWQQPTELGGLPLRGYFVERKFAMRWLRLNYNMVETKCYMNVNDLIEGKEYEFRICAVNELGEGPFSKSSELFIAKNQFCKPDSPGYVDVHATGKSSCTLTWLPPENNGGTPIIQYYIEIKKRGEQKWIPLLHELINECHYKVKNLKENKEYQFRVIADNGRLKSLPSVESRYFRSSGETLPEIEMASEFGNAVGANGRIEALITGTPIPDIRWKKGLRILNSNASKYSMNFSQPFASLIIKNITEEDADLYTVEADNIEGMVSKTCSFLIHGPPVMDVEDKYKNLQVHSAGYDFRLTCQIKGLPRPKVVWSKDGMVIINSENKKIQNITDIDHCLEIKNCNRYNSGIYSVRATNDYGYCTTKFEVLVKDVPDPPSGPLEVKLNSKAKTAFIEWKPPILNGGCDIFGYNVEYLRFETPSEVSPSSIWLNAGLCCSTRFEMENLIRNHFYYFRVIAQNLIGLSDPLENSQPIQAKPVTTSVPSAPGGPILVTNIKSSECTISWSMPEDDGGTQIISFVIEAKDKTKNKWNQLNVVESSKTQYKCLRLVEGYTYNFRVAAKNAIGTSDFLQSDSVVISRPHTVPDSPSYFGCSDKQANSCTLEWRPPLLTGGEELTGYSIDIRTAAQWTNFCQVKANLNAYKALNLEEKTEYYFRISAINRLGYSKPLAIAAPVILTKPKAIPLVAKSPMITPKKVEPEQIKSLPIPKPVPKSIPAPILVTKPAEPKNSILYSGSVPSQPKGPLVVVNITDTTSHFIQKTISWKEPLSDGGSPIIGYLIKKKDTNRPWEKRVSALTHSIKIKELVAHSYYMVQVFAENSHGLSSPLESTEPVRASITSSYIVQDIRMEVLFLRVKGEHLENTVWEPIYASSFFKRKNLQQGIKTQEKQHAITNDKVKFLQSKLKIK